MEAYFNMTLGIWLAGLFLMGLVSMGLCLLFTVACEKIYLLLFIYLFVALVRPKWF
jgi:hypothetical protein